MDEINLLAIILVCYGFAGMDFLMGMYVERRGSSSDRVDTFNHGRAFERQFGPTAEPTWIERAPEPEDEDALLAEYGV
ncbi:MAG: hypothetical protein OEZ65_15895 [Gemmatimonadota bacterium]|nr:hypothetical protein [Gemmatimonadota bacterium]